LEKRRSIDPDISSGCFLIVQSVGDRTSTPNRYVFLTAPPNTDLLSFKVPDLFFLAQISFEFPSQQYFHLI